MLVYYLRDYEYYITSYQNYATRLRYDVKDGSLINEAIIKKANVVGISRVSDKHIQIIIGPKVEILNNEILANKGQRIDQKLLNLT